MTVPTVLRDGPYRFIFYASDGVEPPHIHAGRDDRFAKFWLDPIEMQKSGGLKRTDIRRITRIIEDNQQFLMESWNDFFSE